MIQADYLLSRMATAGGAAPPVAGKLSGNAMAVDKLPEEINEMKIRDEKVEYFHGVC